MHEISLIQSMLDLAFSQAKIEGASQIHQLNLRVGEISGVVPEALQFAFRSCTEGTIAANAKLEIEWVKAVCYCPECHGEFTPIDWVYVCPRCDRLSREIRQGRELQLISLEVS
jgi:hydrogenase nickel incorporation protein HypA/HybF